MRHDLTKHGFTVETEDEGVIRTWDRQDVTRHSAVVLVTEPAGYAGRTTYRVCATRARQPYNALEERWTIRLASNFHDIHNTKLREAVMDVCKIAFREFDRIDARLG